MHACDINKFVGINVRGTCLISKNQEHLYPRKYLLYGSVFSKTSPDGLPPTQIPNSAPMWVVLADYKATEGGMLSVGEGELVEVLDISRNEWCLVRPSTRPLEEGWVPMGYLKPYNSRDYGKHCLNPIALMYCIAGNIRGAKYSWFSWLNTGARIFYPGMKRPYLPLPAVQAATTNI